ncbi:restriction endonuclease subunit S [Streptomyces sp. NPDC058000]|uniref:restriction endonuclease subunit S n=1 Tax=Streptomyces sp. NPDC058000 TaxID=3346299 RepID=UPI0036E2C933
MTSRATWHVLPLGSIVELQRGFDLPTGKRSHGSVPVVGASGVIGRHSEAAIKGPGVTLGRAGAMGVATYVANDFWPLNTTLFVTDFRGNDRKFIYYLLHHMDFSGYNSGGVQPMLNRNYIREIPVPIPVRSEQQAIAEVLGALDDKIAVNERIAETSLALAKARAEAVPPAESVRLGDIAEVFDGPHATPRKTREGPWFLSISSLKGGAFDLAESAHLAEEDFPRWTRRVQPSEGDVLFSYETRLGEAALMPPGVRASLGRRMGLLRPKPGTVGRALLLHAYLSPSFQAEIRRRTVHGATVDRIPLKEMPAWPITLPSDDIRPQLSTALEALHTSINQVAVENRTLAALRDTLLPQLVTGKIRIKDAERVVEDATS